VILDFTDRLFVMNVARLTDDKVAVGAAPIGAEYNLSPNSAWWADKLLGSLAGDAKVFTNC
jgi:hypothetical protein